MGKTVLNEEELIGRIRQGDDRALEIILTGYKEPIRKKAGSMFLIGGEREDLIQEGMIGLLGAIRSYEPDQKAGFAHYADLCITRKMYSAIEASSRQKQIPLNTYISLFEETNPESDNPISYMEVLEDRNGRSPEEVMIDRENTDDLENMLRTRLSKMEQQVADLMVAGMEYTKIAEILGKTPKQVDNAIQRIRKKIKG